ncbi:MAG TPA: hypothetical protein VKP67_23465 [Xanthobacteraceae bacterium]|nr:hypothetical protein [Xanthobacteraceae bacterium]
MTKIRQPQSLLDPLLDRCHALFVFVKSVAAEQLVLHFIASGANGTTTLAAT